MISGQRFPRFPPCLHAAVGLAVLCSLRSAMLDSALSLVQGSPSPAPPPFLEATTYERPRYTLWKKEAFLELHVSLSGNWSLEEACPERSLSGSCDVVSMGARNSRPSVSFETQVVRKLRNSHAFSRKVLGANAFSTGRPQTPDVANASISSKIPARLSLEKNCPSRRSCWVVLAALKL